MQTRAADRPDSSSGGAPGSTYCRPTTAMAGPSSSSSSSAAARLAADNNR
jgi:hypothetical protein